MDSDILPAEAIGTTDQYRKFISSSKGEFSVAKKTYVKSHSGWFSCRSACYLAAGRVVVSQDTSWSKYLPAGEGLFFLTLTIQLWKPWTLRVPIRINNQKKQRKLLTNILKVGGFFRDC